MESESNWKSLRISVENWKKLQLIKYNEELEDLNSVIQLLINEAKR